MSGVPEPLTGQSHDLLRPWLSALPRAVVLLDDGGCILVANAAADELLGVRLSERAGEPFTALAMDERDRGGFEEVLRLTAATGSWSGELRVTGAAGPRPVQARIARAHVGDRPAGVVVDLERTQPGAERAVVVSGRLTRLVAVAAELQRVGDIEGLANVVVSHIADAAGATAASLSTRSGDHLEMVGLRGASQAAATQYARFPIDGDTPAGVAALSREPLLIAGRAELDRRFPALPYSAPGERSLLCLPLVVNQEVAGVATLSFPSRVEIDDAELAVYRAMADTCAQALERIRARETVDAQTAMLRFLAEASSELASSLDYESTLRNVAWLAVPALADWCAIHLEQDGFLRPIAVAHVDPEKVALAMEYERRYPTDPDAQTGAYQVLRTGESLLLPEITDEMIDAGARSAEHAATVRRLNLRSAMTVALRARGRSFGTITWVNGDSARRFSEADLIFGEDIARRAAIAIDNALLHSELKEVADRLQEAVLPAALPEVPGWELGAAYAVAGRVSVGGDFYDAIKLQDGRFALIIGDVMGRGVEAASAMAQVRSAVRAFVAVDPDPQVVLNRLDLLYERFPSEQLVTLLYALVDPRLDQVVLTCAGHPPPLLLDEAGNAEFIDTVRGTILGVGRVERRRTVVPFLPGQTLLMFTDGVLERRGEDLQDSKDRLAETCRRLRPRPTHDELEQLAAVMRDPTRDDDVAVLGARRLPH